MSEEKPKEIETKEEEPKVNDIVGDNVALLKSKIIAQDELIAELTEKLDALNTKYEQAREFMEDEAKAELLAYIAPRYDMPRNLLVMKNFEELKKLKADIDRVQVPAFKSGTQFVAPQKTSQRALLDNTFERDQAKRMGGKK